MQVKDKFSKKQTDLKILIVFFLTIFISKNLSGEIVDSKIKDYLEGLGSFSSKFIQSDGTSLEEGLIYINNEKIRLDYFNPSRTLKIGRVKGVYINHELKEEEFFSTKKNIVKTFYDIFLDKNFFSSLPFKEKNGEIVFEKIFTIESNIVDLKIYFENKPFLLRKIVSNMENSTVSISLFDHNYNEVFDERFFSFVPIYLD